MKTDPVIVAYADADHPHEVMSVAICEGNYGCHVPLMTVAQHERIVAGLEADAARYRWLRNEAADAPNGTPTVVFGAGMDKILEGPWLDAAIDKAVGDAFLAQPAEGV